MFNRLRAISPKGYQHESIKEKILRENNRFALLVLRSRRSRGSSRDFHAGSL